MKTKIAVHSSESAIVGLCSKCSHEKHVASVLSIHSAKGALVLAKLLLIFKCTVDLSADIVNGDL